MQAENSDIESQEEEVKQIVEQKEDHKTLNHHSLYYNFIQRYFTSFQTKTQFLHRHSNGLYIVRVKTQALPSPPASIKSLFKAQQVKGKKKRGGSKIAANTVIAEIVCQNGFVLPVYALVEGIVLEINQRLTPQLLERPQGYIAVINPHRKFKTDPNLFEPILLPHQQE